MTATRVPHVPRPSRVSAALAARYGPPALDLSATSAVLGRYGLTAIAGHPVNVNMDQVAFIECSQDVTELHFISGAHPQGTVILGVRENLEDINTKNPLPTT